MVHYEAPRAVEPEPEPVAEMEPEPEEPEPEPEPEPVREPTPEPEPEPEPEVVPEPEPEPEEEPEDPILKQKAGLKILRALRSKMWRSDYLRQLAAFKAAEKERLNRISEGKSGSVGCAVDAATMKIMKKAFKEDGAAGNAGIEPEDLVIAVTAKGRGGASVTESCPNSVQFLGNIGPPNEVFEGDQITIHIVRGAANQKAWLDAKPETDPKPTKKQEQAWQDAMASVTTEEKVVTIMPETDGARRTRLKKLEARKKDLGIDTMDIQLVNNFMSDPEACKEFTKKVFLKADKDGSGVLDQGEISGVFVEMAKYTGCKPPGPKAQQILFYLMDENAGGEVDFDEFYPQFRSHQIKAINDLLFDTQ